MASLYSRMGSPGRQDPSGNQGGGSGGTLFNKIFGQKNLDPWHLGSAFWLRWLILSQDFLVIRFVAGEDLAKQESRVIGVGGVLACSCEDRFIEEEQWVFIPNHPRRGSGCCSGCLPSFCPCFRHVSRR